MEASHDSRSAKKRHKALGERLVTSMCTVGNPMKVTGDSEMTRNLLTGEKCFMMDADYAHCS